MVREELLAHGVEVVTGVQVTAIGEEGGRLVVQGAPDLTLSVDLVLVVVWVRPDSELAAAAGAEIGVKDAIRVDRRMRTTLPDMALADRPTTYFQPSVRLIT